MPDHSASLSASSSSHVPAVVVGGGPIGIETAIALRRRGIDAVVVEAGTIGHTISWWAPHTRWFSSNDRIAIAGVPLTTVDQSKASREEYLNYLRSVVNQFKVPMRTFTRVEWIEPVEAADQSDSRGRPESTHPLYRLTLRKVRGERTSAWRAPSARPGELNCVDDATATPHFDQKPDRSGTTQAITTRCVVLAIGGTDYPNRLKVPGEDLPHVDGYLREIHRYHGRDVLVVGGRNSAVEGAIRLHRGGARVSLSYHRDALPDDSIKYWLRPEMEGLIGSGAIQAFFGTRIKQIDADHVTLLSTNGEPDIRVRADDVLTLIGYRQDDSMWKCLGIEQVGPGKAPTYNDETMETKWPGIYVAGTAIGGTQSSKFQIFLENCHPHAEKIARHVEAQMLSEKDLPTISNSGDRDPARHRAESPSSALKRRIELQPES